MSTIDPDKSILFGQVIWLLPRKWQSAYKKGHLMLGGGIMREERATVLPFRLYASGLCQRSCLFAQSLDKWLETVRHPRFFT